MALEDRVVKASEVGPTEGSLTLIGGPPGTGKSFFCGTAPEWDGVDPDEILVIATMPRELKSTKYQEHDLDAVVLTDHGWDPENDSLKATAFDELRDVLAELRDDEDYGMVIVDNGTQMGEYAWHASLEPFGVSTPPQLGPKEKWDPYVEMGDKMENLLTDLVYLTGEEGSKVSRPKLVAVPWHIQPAKEQPGGGESADEKGEGVEYEGKYLFQIRGGFRRKVASYADNVVFSDHIKDRSGGSRYGGEHIYAVQVRKDRERHVKLAGPMPDEDDLINGKYIRNEWSDFMELLA